MIAAKRHALILEILRREGFAETGRLCELVDASPMTLWRDLKTLEARGVLARVRGGVATAESVEPTYAAKEDEAVETKASIGKRAAQRFVKDGDVLFLDGGTTVGALIPWLRHEGLTIITNSLHILRLASELRRGHTLLCPGGILREVSNTLVGPDAVKALQQLRADTFFMSATGLSREGWLMDPNPLEIAVKQAMIQSASKTVLLCDTRKFGASSLQRVCRLQDVRAVVTDAKPPRSFARVFKETEFIVVQREPNT